MATHKKVLVLYGGWNAEREVNLSSTPDVIKALEKAGHTVVSYDLDRDLLKFLEFIKEQKPDVVFNNIYGRYGEDGHIQGVLEIIKIPYTHSGLHASSASMYKPFTQTILHDNNIPVPQNEVVNELTTSKLPLPFPFVLKPCDEGSSVGVGIITNQEEYEQYLDKVVPEIGFPLMAETYIPGHELSVAVLGGKAYGVLELRPKKGFYDYTAKCVDGVTEHIYPADVPKEIYDLCLEYAEKSFAAIGCEGLARIDMRFDPDRGRNGIFILDVNPQPGLTSLSIAPEIMGYNGMDFPALLDWLVQNPRCPE